MTFNPDPHRDKSKAERIRPWQSPTLEAVQVNRLLEETIDPSMFLNARKLICDGANGTCPLFIPSGNSISFDGAHLTRQGARYLGWILFNHSPLNYLLAVENERTIRS